MMVGQKKGGWCFVFFILLNVIVFIWLIFVIGYVLFISYKSNCQMLKDDAINNEIEILGYQKKETIYSFNIFILDFCDFLWRRKVFSYGRNDFYLNFDLEYLVIEVSDGFFLYLYQVFLLFVLLFLKEVSFLISNVVFIFVFCL